MKNIVHLKPNTNIDNILEDYPEATTFIFNEGNYYMNKIFRVNKENIKLLGISRASDIHIFQTNENADGFDVEADGFTMKNISVHVEHDNKVAISVAGCDNTVVRNNYFYGNSNTFCIYYAGPKVKAGEDTINAYFDNNLDSNNIFERNVIYSKWSGDTISFSLQKNGIIRDNIVRGGKLAIYMCNSVVVTKNKIYDSTSQGIYISFPSQSISISLNDIYECKEAGIKMKNQVEHGETPHQEHNITISNNKLYDIGTYAIEMNDADKINIIKNKFLNNTRCSVYSLRSYNINISRNIVSYFDTAFWIESSENTKITENKVYSIYPYTAKNFVRIIFESNKCEVINNEIYGDILNSELYSVSNNSTNITIDDNIFQKYYNYNDERQVIKYL